MPTIKFEAQRAPWDRIVGPPEAEKIAGTCWKTLQRRHQRGELKIVELSPRRRGIWLSDLMAALETPVAT